VNVSEHSEGGVNESVIWSSQLADKLHKPAIKKFPKRKVFVNVLTKFGQQTLT